MLPLFLPNTYCPSSKPINFFSLVHWSPKGTLSSVGRAMDVLEEVTSVLNGPGPPKGPAVGLPRALDGTGRQKAVRSRLGNLGTAVIVKDGVPYNLRQIGVGEPVGQRGTAGDCRAEFLLHSIISLARQKHEYVQNIIKEALSCSSKWRGGLLVSPQYRMIARSGTYLIYMVDY